jgi:hypothetical protein
MLDEEVGEHGEDHIETSDIPERRQVPHVLVHRYRVGLAQSFLDEVVEIAKPIVDFYIKLDLVPCHEQDQPRPRKGPKEPPTR